MKKTILRIFLIVLSCFNYVYSQETQSSPAIETRALCVGCPTGGPGGAAPATFCNLCVTGTVVVGDLIVQKSLSVCSGVTGQNFNDSISWNTDETHYNVKDFPENPVTPTYFQPYATGPVGGFRDTFTGWPIVPARETGSTNLTITAEFEVPQDLDPSVTPTVTLHWFNPNQADLECTGTSVNWQVTADYYSNLQPVQSSPKYVLSSGTIPITYSTAPTGPGLVQQQVNIPLVGPALVPGAYGQISATRIATVPGNIESDCVSYLTLIALRYRKLAQ